MEESMETLIDKKYEESVEKVKELLKSYKEELFSKLVNIKRKVLK